MLMHLRDGVPVLATTVTARVTVARHTPPPGAAAPSAPDAGRAFRTRLTRARTEAPSNGCWFVPADGWGYKP